MHLPRDGRETELEILDLLQRLEDQIAESHRIPLTAKVLVDEQAVYQILDDLRRTLPEELAQARFIVRDRERILSEARQAADRMVADAREEAIRLSGESEIQQLAQEQAEEVLGRAREVAQEIKLEADRYADEVLAKVQGSLERAVETIRVSRESLLPHRRGQADAAGDSHPEPSEDREAGPLDAPSAAAGSPPRRWGRRSARAGGGLPVPHDDSA